MCLIDGEEEDIKLCLTLLVRSIPCLELGLVDAAII